MKSRGWGRRDVLAGLSAATATLALGRSARSQAQTRPYRIDTHHHVASPGFTAAIKARNTGQFPLMNWTPQKSIEDMDQGGVATSILSTSDPSVWFGDDAAAQRLARECNDYCATLVSDYPGRFGFFAAIPLPDIDGALREISYALDTLECNGICMMTDYNGKFLGDPRFSPVLEELNRRKAVVYTHPFRNDCCKGLTPNVMEAIIELGTDTSRTIASLVFNGAAHRFPDIRWIFSHAGGTVPFLLQRFVFWQNMRKDLAPANFPNGVVYELRRFYYDTASASTRGPLVSLLNLVSPQQILFGTDFPFLNAASTAQELRETGLFGAADLISIERGNAVRLMPRYKI